jgi:hypothetical protein
MGVSRQSTYTELASMTLLRSLPENATLADLRRSYADLLEKLLEAHSVHGNEANVQGTRPDAEAVWLFTVDPPVAIEQTTA